MKAIFWIRPERDHARSDWRETNLAQAIQNGAALCGDEVQIKDYTGTPEVEKCDLVLGVGVKRRDLFRAYNAAGISYCYFDKGYDRKRASEWLEYWRVSVNGHQPLRYVEHADNDSQRADSMRLSLTPDWYSRNKAKRYIMVDGSSPKHHYFHLQKALTQEELVAYAEELSRSLVQRVCDQSQRPIIYRPKPSNRHAKRIMGHAGGEPIQWSRDKDPVPDLSISHAVVTYSSNICLDAILYGVPAIVLGDGIARPISSQSLDELERPRLANIEERQRWLNNACWCQFKVNEFANGLGWQTIREMYECSPL